MTKPINTDSIAKATNRSWEQWVSELDAAGGRALSHTEIAQKLTSELDGKIDSSSWWAQSITVAYEQHIGRRVPGQLADGLFEIAVTKSVPFTRSTSFSKLEKWLSEQDMFNGQLSSNQRMSETPKRSNWRCDFADGSKFSATVEGTDKAMIVLSHTAIPSRKKAEDWKEYWKSLLAEFVQTL